MSAGTKCTLLLEMAGLCRMQSRFILAVRLPGTLGLTWSRSVRPTSSSMVRTPSLAMYSRNSWATKVR